MVMLQGSQQAGLGELRFEVFRSFCGARAFGSNSKADAPLELQEFDQFMAIKGCAEALSHSREKQELPESAKPIQSSPSGPANVSANGVETYGSSSSSSSTSQQPITQPLTGSSLAAAQKAASAASSESGGKTEEKPEEQDSEDATVPDGAKCKRNGCGQVYAGQGKRDRSMEECKYHKGVAVFHEGSKVSKILRAAERAYIDVRRHFRAGHAASRECLNSQSS